MTETRRPSERCKAYLASNYHGYVFWTFALTCTILRC